MLSPKLFDHTILKADATEASVKKICDEAREYGFMSVCVNSYYTAFVTEQLKGSGVKVCSVIGFPLGQMSTAAKAAETSDVVANGADEVDMVLNVAALKDQKYDFVKEDIRGVKAACQGRLLKVILETCLLTREEIVKACQLAEEAGADYVKTSTGFSTGGATAEDVALMRATVGDRLGVKASGGIRDTAKAEAMVAAGASRIGASATISILSGN
ncbi:MAG: deoxyribose-phosphate aldolase [Lachnospiraceae bacterium]|nr:deoxyribose-phosphate aldolase [Lachnospiraceae bacterium]